MTRTEIAGAGWEEGDYNYILKPYSVTVNN